MQVEKQALLTVEAAAHTLAVSYPTVRRLMRDQILEVVRVGRTVRIPATAVANYIQQHQSASA